jgi:hypothetical protein
MCGDRQERIENIGERRREGRGRNERKKLHSFICREKKTADKGSRNPKMWH